MGYDVEQLSYYLVGSLRWYICFSSWFLVLQLVGNNKIRSLGSGDCLVCWHVIVAAFLVERIRLVKLPLVLPSY